MTFNVNVRWFGFLSNRDLRMLNRSIAELKELLVSLKEGQIVMSEVLDDLVVRVQEQKGQIASVVTLLEGLHQKLVEAGTDAVKLQAVRDQLAENTSALADAVAANPLPDAAP